MYDVSMQPVEYSELCEALHLIGEGSAPALTATSGTSSPGYAPGQRDLRPLSLTICVLGMRA